MSWHYRPCKIVSEDRQTSHWDVRRFYQLEEGGAWSENSIYPFGETLEELKRDMQLIIKDIEKREPLVLYVYTCTSCKEQDARTEADRTICEACLEKDKI